MTSNAAVVLQLLQKRCGATRRRQRPASSLQKENYLRCLQQAGFAEESSRAGRLGTGDLGDERCFAWLLNAQSCHDECKASIAVYTDTRCCAN